MLFVMHEGCTKPVRQLRESVVRALVVSIIRHARAFKAYILLGAMFVCTTPTLLCCAHAHCSEGVIVGAIMPTTCVRAYMNPVL